MPNPDRSGRFSHLGRESATFASRTSRRGPGEIGTAGNIQATKNAIHNTHTHTHTKTYTLTETGTDLTQTIQDKQAPKLVQTSELRHTNTTKEKCPHTHRSIAHFKRTQTHRQQRNRQTNTQTHTSTHTNQKHYTDNTHTNTRTRVQGFYLNVGRKCLATTLVLQGRRPRH